MAGAPPRRRRRALALMAPLALLGAGVAPGSAALALAHAPRDGIEVVAPARAKRNVTYDVTISGYSHRRAKAYLFVDYQGCAKSLTAELSRAGSESDTYAVKGGFAQTSGWDSSQVGTDHACAYLVSAAGSVLATAKRAYPVS